MLARWGVFNLVGVVGAAVQLGVLAVLSARFPGHYMVETAIAIEITLLHNFLWHQRTTWRDRRSDTSTLAQLARFHLANGLVSLLGNLALMRILVGSAHLPVLIANGLSILACSLVNFCFGHNWVFAAPA